MEQEFGDKSALITGAASGIGLAVAYTLARSGAVVIVADYDESAAMRAARAIASEGRRAY